MADKVEERFQYTSMSGCFMRVVWGMAGPAFVLVCSLLIIANKSPYGSLPDFMMLAGAIACIVARVLDPGIVDPNKSDGDIGTLSPKKYAAWILIGTVLVLVIAHSIAPLVH